MVTRRDSLFQNDTLVAFALLVDKKIKCYHRANQDLSDKGNDFIAVLKGKYPKGKIQLYVDSYINYPCLLFVKGKVVYKNQALGKYKNELPHFGNYNNHQVIVEIQESITDDFEKFVISRALMKFETTLETEKINVVVLSNVVSRKQYNLDSARIANFYDFIYLRLSNELSSIEGVYKSIDQGESYEYDIVILKSETEKGKFVGWILESTDPDLKVGYSIMTFIKTATADKYFVEYTIKSGEKFENKLAIFDSGILSMGIKSFVKMYPSVEDSRKYNQINPLVDWDASGSGVIIDARGLVATNHHVIEGAKKIRIKISVSDSIFKEFEARVLVEDVKNDIAILQIQDTSFANLKIKSRSFRTNFKLGDEVMTLGYPNPMKFGENVKYNVGRVSGMTGAGENNNYFQTDLPIWYGNSGGGCFDHNGNILGLTTLIAFDRGQKVENIGYITKANNIVDLLKDTRFADGIKIVNDLTEKKIEVNELLSSAVLVKVNYK